MNNNFIKGVKGVCKTSLDGYTMYVNLFYEIPKIGDEVMCLKNGKPTSLSIVKITHDVLDTEPFIIVELNLSRIM
jgi:hypothetical protein